MPIRVKLPPWRATRALNLTGEPQLHPELNVLHHLPHRIRQMLDPQAMGENATERQPRKRKTNPTWAKAMMISEKSSIISWQLQKRRARDPVLMLLQHRLAQQGVGYHGRPTLNPCQMRCQRHRQNREPQLTSSRRDLLLLGAPCSLPHVIGHPKS